MNGQHLKAVPKEELLKSIGCLEGGIDVITDAEKLLSDLLSYPLHATLSSPEGGEILDGLSVVAAAYDSGELLGALEQGKSGWQKWVKAFGKSLKRKGKSLFMPLRVLLTGKLHGPDMGETILLIHRAGASAIVGPQVDFLSLEQRLQSLKQVNWEAFSRCFSLSNTSFNSFLIIIMVFHVCARF